MIHAVSDTCSVRWTKVNHKVYKFQSLVFNNDKKQFEEVEPINPALLISSSTSNTENDDEEKKQTFPSPPIKSQSEESSNACPSNSKITGPIQWKQVYGEYLGKETDVPQVIRGSPNLSRKSFESPTKISRKSPESPLLKHRKGEQQAHTDKENSVKKDQRRVHFEDEVGVNNEDDDDVFEPSKQSSCLTDCALCRSIGPPRDISPPYQALVEKSRHCNAQSEEKLKSKEQRGA